jgi:hypothetical protein
LTFVFVKVSSKYYDFLIIFPPHSEKTRFFDKLAGAGSVDRIDTPDGQQHAVLDVEADRSGRGTKGTLP